MDFDAIPETALAWYRQGKGAALATVVETWGSAPRPVGSQLAISGDAGIAGSVSGGCVESAVVTEALDAIEDGKRRILEFGVSDETAFEVGLACGGKIRVMVEPIGGSLSEDILAKLVAKRAARAPIAYVVGADGRGELQDPALHAARFRADKSGFEEDGETFVAVHNPPLRMAIIGAVHIAQALVPMAKMAGYDTLIVDPRAAFASEERFPGETLECDDWPDVALKNWGLDSRTAVVTLSHDPKIDDPALIAALNSDVFYIGSLGSKRTHAKRVERLDEAGFSAEDIARIHGPVGLNIQARTPTEIALAILAEVTAVLRNGA
ncbi:XdhC family protein [Halocynthiibacter sp. C4]|uniref:XdhC family protein n=1 Tax=Halocynthiibacter sp. C4 TaxID=2992758 RepID=UPI00237BC104|nr:XdhC family protein [Halocynthiibacter sp. C4]MDE0589312.1 XdhC family protein [Halocynthiibacter sp. C4]